MIGSLFNDLKPNQTGDDPELTENLHGAPDLDETLVASLGVAQKILRRKGLFFRPAEGADIIQAIALRLLKWRDKYREKSQRMSEDEWQSFAARTAYNEISRHYSNQSASTGVSLDAVGEAALGEALEGQSGAEVCSLAFEVWQRICSLTLRQRQALLLGSQELVIYFLQCGITDEQLAESLNLTAEEWTRVKENLPLKNIEIAQIVRQLGGKQNDLESIARSVKKARHEARVKIRRAVEK